MQKSSWESWKILQKLQFTIYTHKCLPQLRYNWRLYCKLVINISEVKFNTGKIAVKLRDGENFRGNWKQNIKEYYSIVNWCGKLILSNFQWTKGKPLQCRNLYGKAEKSYKNCMYTTIARLNVTYKAIVYVGRTIL